MSDATNEILASLPIDQLAQQVGASPEETQQAVQAALPALFGGLQANAADRDGASSILEALTQHDPSLVEGGVDLGQVDPTDGEKIASHIFGSNQEQVVNQLGGIGGGSGLVKKLLPILAPIVLSYIMKQMSQKTGGSINLPGQSGSTGGSGGGVLPGSGAGTAAGADAAGGINVEDILGQVLGQATGRGQETQAQQGGGSIITDILGGLLGGGRR
ncbi:DUF937 domain-containing protein [Janibacter sp. G56]|uniref:DUF937 domain-containing protein n=1 Tax=Janibacter sp. G56 TaxID=3418717 RepID=UPI003D0280D0